MSQVITISRQYGSGGRELGEKLAKELGIPFYDKEMINMIARKENIEVALLEACDEMEPDLDNYTMRDVTPHYQIDMAKKVFDAYSRMIVNLAKKGPCVIVGRCSDVILPDSVKIFVYADDAARIERLRRIHQKEEMSEDRAAKEIRKMDKRRSNYRKFFCDREWGRMSEYDLCLNTGRTGVDGAVETALTYVKNAK
ncbi:MAG: AAA family ATPase [Enterocloster sp.]